MTARPARAETSEQSPILLRQTQGSIAVLTLNRPEARNCLSEQLITDLHAALDAAGQDPAVRAVVIAANGPAFSSGHDLKELTAHRTGPDRGREYFAHMMTICSAMMQAIVHLPKPVVACVQGIATAAGCQLVAMCDLAIAARDARFAVSGVNLGLFCSTPSVALSRNLGRKAAFEMLVTGDFIDAETARERGLVNRVVAAESLDAEVEALLARILDKPRVALEMGKALFYRQLECGTEAALKDASRTMAANMIEDTALEGVQAFLEKRRPAWRG